MKSSKFGVPTICVGNLNMGGTGKTPHIEYLIRLLKEEYKVATLSRGFGRKQRGFIIADASSDAEQIGDEPLQFYKKFGDKIIVSVEADRVLGAMDLFRVHEDVEVLLLDDAFQHRKIFAGMSILLSDYSDPFYKDFVLPVGNLRESRAGKKRANIIIVTKCPDLTPEEKKKIENKIGPTSEQYLFFSHIKYGDVHSFQGEPKDIEGRNLIVVTGVANAKPLVEHLKEKATILKHFNYSDHHNFKGSELDEVHDLFNKFADENPLIITTEKDAMRLLSEKYAEQINAYDWNYQSIQVKIDRQEVFENLILDYVKENR